MTNSRTDVLQQIFKNFKRKTRLLHSLFSFNRSNVETICTLEGWIFCMTSRHSFLISVKEMWIPRSRVRVRVPHLSFAEGHHWSGYWMWLVWFFVHIWCAIFLYLFTYMLIFGGNVGHLCTGHLRAPCAYLEGGWLKTQTQQDNSNSNSTD